MFGIRDRTLQHLPMYLAFRHGSAAWTSPSMFLSLLLAIQAPPSALLDQVLDILQSASLKVLEQIFNLR